jgi:hypothetical protein
MKHKEGLLSVRRLQKIFMSNASELFAQSSSLHRQAARGRALREPVWTLASRRAFLSMFQLGTAGLILKWIVLPLFYKNIL